MSEHLSSDRDTNHDCGDRLSCLNDEATCSNIIVWHCAVLISVENYYMLRRQCGQAGARALVADVATCLEGITKIGIASVVGRDLIELRFITERYNLVDEVAARITMTFDRPFDTGNGKRQLDLILGCAVSKAHVRDDVRLIEEAEAALRAARVDRMVVIRTLSEQPEAIDRIELVDRLAEAIANDEFVLHFQPKVNLRRQRVCGVEALLRWQHPTRGLIMPGAFMPLAEESRHMVDLTLWTIRRAMFDQQRLKQAGYDLPVFVNISGIVLNNVRFVEEAASLIGDRGTAIGFEITETAVIRDPDTAIANLKRFADIGIVLAIDDYGAGLSSLAYLKQLPAKELKIDKLFITQLTSSNRDPLIVRSTIDLAHALEMEVVAEGIETVAAMALLSVMGCDMGQGYLISYPVEFSSLLELLRSDYQSKLSLKFDNPLRRFAYSAKNI